MVDKYTFRGLVDNPVGDVKYEWVYGSYIPFGEFPTIFPHDGSPFRKVKAETVGLWSTFRDKHDKPIFHGDVVLDRFPARDTQIHSGPNIPMGYQEEPLEPIIMEEWYVIEYKDGMFQFDKDGEGACPLSWCNFTWDLDYAMHAFSNGFGYNNSNRWTWNDHPDDSDLPYLLSEYGYDSEEELVASLGIEIIGNVYTDERYKDWI